MATTDPVGGRPLPIALGGGRPLHAVAASRRAERPNQMERPAMPGKIHAYAVTVTWTGNEGSGTSAPGAYSRAHVVDAAGKPQIAGSSDPSFRGDAARWNPEELLVASLSACHKLWYLGLCAGAGVTVLAYEDTAIGEMVEESSGAGQFTSVTLRPSVTISAGSNRAKAEALHHKAHEMCFIARSVNFSVGIEAAIRLEG